jgi:phosphatidate cytidylyltransferase
MSNLTKRILSSLVLVPPIVALIVWGPPIAFRIFIAVVAGVAGSEFGMITIGRPSTGHRFVPTVLACLVCYAVSYAVEAPWAPLVALVLIGPLACVAFMVEASDLKAAASAAAYTVTGALYTGGLLGCITLIFTSSEPEGRYWVILLAAGTFIGDTMAYAVGRLLGKRKLAPKISPGKTWAGAVGGALGTMGCVALAKATLLPQLEWLDVLIFGLPLAAACQIGDLVESFWKRGLGVKDSGRLIPGHGGILDRIDGLMLGAPMVLLMTLLR